MSLAPQMALPAAERDATETLRQDAAAQEQAAALSGPRVVPPAAVAGFDVQRCLGVGAYGSVWLATERNTGKQVAIKFYSHRRGLDWSLLNREVEKLAVLYTSRDIVGLLQVGWDSDPPYYVMEYLQNGSLSRLLERGALPAPDAVRIATAVTGALVHAHQHGILHCDVKPANVLLDGDFAPRLADFGQARLSHEQSPALGTLFYMAPEQADLNAVPDPRWDVYALGAMLYHMLCGEPPFRTPDNERRIREAGGLEQKLAAYRRVVEEGPRLAKHRTQRGVDARLADIVDRCLATDPRRRFRHASEVAEALAARARDREMRPRVWLGIILPGVLLVSLFPLAVMAVRSAATTAEDNIGARALESDTVAAKLLAFSLKDDLEERLRTLSEIADYPELLPLLPGALAAPGSDERRRLQAYLDEDKGRIDEKRRQTGSDLDDSWFLTDVHGFQRWRNPVSRVSQDENYAWRDYFHGQGDDHPEWEGRGDVPPLERPHISAPFRSTTTGQIKIALSVPVRDAEKKVIGVLSRTIQLGSLLSSYKRLIGDDDRDKSGARVLALLDTRRKRGLVLDHPWMTPANMAKLKDNEVYERLTIRLQELHSLEALRQLVRDGKPAKGHNVDEYFDPVAKVDAEAMRDYGMPWLAAFWPVGDTGWVAVVQEQREEALRPVQEITAGLLQYALAGVVLCVTLVATSWYFVRRLMRAQSGQTNGNGSGSRGSGSLSGSLIGSNFIVSGPDHP